MGFRNKEHRPLQDVETARRQFSPFPLFSNVAQGGIGRRKRLVSNSRSRIRSLPQEAILLDDLIDGAMV